ncbi:hypothetical protein JTF06_14225 [Desemzia sp. RIT804]|uniref:hypothetical protein n=1 Tax=Desemzia sp. RIT 804 TaxID=2810209 RepID=UPI00194F2BB0|nr:hypothetical protein [Desemzia sp. RIT 804]MBM6616045.1 hypothetical protein [Desemzia sp. RIT 804]
MNNKKFKVVEIHLEADVYEQVQEYCALEELEEKELVSCFMSKFVKEKLNIIDTLRKGYAEMAGINLDICNEFEECEKEVLSQY